MQSTLTLQGITKTYDANGVTQVVLENLDFEFNASQTTFVLGPSGSGKSTLLNIIAGINRDYRGCVYFNGAPIEDYDAFRRHAVSFIFQDSNLIGHHSLLKNITLALTNDVADKEQLARNLLSKVGLAQYADKRPEQLSTGERQRVSIARALARDSAILICDEPTGSLDEKTKIEITELILEVFADKCIIFVTHDEDLAARYADRIVKIVDKRLVVVGAKRPADADQQAIATSEIAANCAADFSGRFYSNILAQKLKLVNSVYLLMVIAAIVMFTAGTFQAVNRGIDTYLYRTYKVDRIVVNNVTMSHSAILQNVDDYNAAHGDVVRGVSVSLPANIQVVDRLVDHAVVVNSMQPANRSQFAEDITVGHFPENANQIIFSKAAAYELLYQLNMSEIEQTDNAARRELFYRLQALRDEEILHQLQSLPIRYKNSCQFNNTKHFDESLEIVGLIDDLRYYEYFSPELLQQLGNAGHDVDMAMLVAMFKRYGAAINYPIYAGQSEFSDKIYVNGNIYLLEEQFINLLNRVYLSESGYKFSFFSIFIDEDLTLRQQTHANYLTFKSIFKGRDAISEERRAYFDDIYGYKLSVVFTLALLALFGLISTYHGLKNLIVGNHKNIGIYRSLGYTGKDIRQMFIKEGLIIALLVAGGAVLLLILISASLTIQFVDVLDPNRVVSLNSWFNLEPYSLIATGGIVVLVIVLAINSELKNENIDQLMR